MITENGDTSVEQGQFQEDSVEVGVWEQETQDHHQQVKDMEQIQGLETDYQEDR